MHATRCRFFSNDGTPLHGGCTSPNCQYVHPDDKDRWNNLPPTMYNVRCKHYNNNGTAKGYGCSDSSRECRWVHPDDPKWRDATPSKFTQPRVDRSVALPPYVPLSSVPSAPRSLRDVSAQSLRDAGNTPSYAARPVLPRIQTDTLKDGRGGLSSHPSIRLETLPGAGNPNNLPAPEGSMSPGVAPLRSSLSEPLAFRVPVRDPVLSPEGPGSAVSFSIESDQRSLWKKRLSLLTQALGLRLEISGRDANFERRQYLQPVDMAPIIARSARNNLQGFQSSSEEKSNEKVFEEKLGSLITQLIDSEIWPPPNPAEPVAQLGTDWCFDRRAALVERLDEAESQLKTGTWLDILADHSSTVNAPFVVRDADYTKSNDPPPRPFKRRRTSPNGSIMRLSKLSGVTELLDGVEQRAIELETESLHGERLEELIEEVIETIIYAGGFLERHEQSGYNKPSSEKTALDHCPLLETLGSAVQNLNSEFDACCVEQAENVATSGVLDVKLGDIRAETGSIKENLSQLEMGQRLLREKQDDIDHQIRDIEKEIVTLRSISHFDELANAQSRLANAVAKDIQGSVNVSCEQLESSIDTQRSAMVRSMLASIEPTLLVTEHIYESMARHFEEGRGSLEVAGET